MKKATLKEIQKMCRGKSINGIVKSICGKQIGTGLYRDVYLLKQDNNYVVKIERDMSTGTFANATEWRNYINNKEWSYIKDWLAPIELINQTSQVLVQRRVSLEGKKCKDFPKYIPALFTDLKRKNFGWIGDKFVCCDYSFFVSVIINKGKNKLKYAKWWGNLI